MTALQQVTDEALGWPGVSTEPGRFGATTFKLKRRELGHLHGDSIADIPLRRDRRDELVASGAAEAHHFIPDSGWVTVPLDREERVALVLELMRENYERGLAKQRG